jgi:hypothetical protein
LVYDAPEEVQMRRPAGLILSLMLVLTALCAVEVSDPELDQLDLELRTYTPAENWITPYASNGPFCCPISQLVVSGENLVAVSSSGYWMSPNGDNWTVINRKPPDMLASTGDAIFIYLQNSGLMVVAGAGQFSPIRNPVGGPLADLTEMDGVLYAVNSSGVIFTSPEEAYVWKKATAPPDPSVRSIVSDGTRLYLGLGKDGQIYQSKDRGSSWAEAGRLPPGSGEFKRLVNLNDGVYAVTESGLFRDAKKDEPSWQRVIEAPSDSNLYAVVDFNGKRYAGTDRGLYLLENGKWALRHAMLSRGQVTQVSYGEGTLFASTKNGLFESEDTGRTWNASTAPLGRGIATNGVVRRGRDVAATDRGLFVRAGRNAPWTAAAVDENHFRVASIAVTDKGNILIATIPPPGSNSSAALYEGGEGGSLDFQKLPAVPYASSDLHVAAVGQEVFALPSHGAYRLSPDRLSWIAEDSLAARQVSNIVKRGDAGIAAMIGAENIFLRSNAPTDQWTQLHVAIPGATSAWFDPAHPEVVVAITPTGLAWNSNIFEPTRPVDHWFPNRLGFYGVLSICGIPSSANQRATLAIGTDYGVYLLEDKLHRQGWLERTWRDGTELWEKYSKEPWFWPVSVIISAITAYTLAALAIFLLAWKGIGGWLGADWLLTLVTKPMEIFPRLLRWVLFFGYRKRLLRLPEMVEVQERYFGLPALFSGGTATDPDAEGDRLHKQIASVLANSNCLLIEGEGGAGKSTVLARLATLGLAGKLPAELRSCIPLYIPASAYESDLIQATTDTLKRRDGIPLDRHGDIIRQQLQAGGFLVLFDGVSEIDGDKAKALAKMVALASEKEMRGSWFIFCTRPLKRTPDGLPVARLQPLEMKVIQKIYLPMRSGLDPEQQKQVLRQLRSFGTGPIEPLLLTLAINDSLNSTIATTKASLFERYFRRLLRVQGESDQTSWEGWRTILETFADWFMLDTGRRGVGLSHRVLVRFMGGSGLSKSLLARIESEYGLAFPNEISVLQQLASVGILTSGIHWLFRHDSFEAYFAASRVLMGLEDEDPVDLQIWTGPSAKEFLPVIEFLREMGTPALIEKLFLETPGIPGIWRDVLIENVKA